MAANAAAPAAGASAELIPSTVKIRLGHLHKGRAMIFSSVRVIGSLTPFVPTRRSRSPSSSTPTSCAPRPPRCTAARATSASSSQLIVRKGGKYAASARLAPDKRAQRRPHGAEGLEGQLPLAPPRRVRQGGRGLQAGLNRLGYSQRRRCFSGKTARGVLAYRKVKGMSRNSARRQAPGAGWSSPVAAAIASATPASASTSRCRCRKQVLVFAKGDKAVAIYPISSGKPSTPTVHGHFNFYSTQPGYNSHGMYYSLLLLSAATRSTATTRCRTTPPATAASAPSSPTSPRSTDRIFIGEDIFVF